MRWIDTQDIWQNLFNLTYLESLLESLTCFLNVKPPVSPLRSATLLA